MYSENLFLFFTLVGLWIMTTSVDLLPFATLAFGLASMTRSAGALLIIYVAYSLGK